MHSYLTPLQDFREVKQVCEALYDGKGPNEIGERDHGGVQNYQEVSTFILQNYKTELSTVLPSFQDANVKNTQNEQ